MRSHLCLVPSSMLAVSLCARAAIAQSNFPEASTWAVKFVCGLRTQASPARADWNTVAPGTYRTAINILNVSTDTLKLSTSIAFTRGDPTMGDTVPGPVLELRPSHAAEVDCADLLAVIRQTSFAKGFLIIDSAARLAVTAVYTAANSTGVSSIDVEELTPVGSRRICPDLIIGPFRRPIIDATNNRTTVVAAVKNIGTAPAPISTARVDDPNRTDALRTAEASVPELVPGATATVNLILQYVVTGNENLAALILTIDPKNLIAECREDNNHQTVGAP
jgi:hypothetical protein